MDVHIGVARFQFVNQGAELLPRERPNEVCLRDDTHRKLQHDGVRTSRKRVARLVAVRGTTPSPRASSPPSSRSSFYRLPLPTLEAARTVVFEYIEVFSNRQRLHPSISGLPPATYEASCLTPSSAPAA
jgi:hypothetical protein